MDFYLMKEGQLLEEKWNYLPSEAESGGSKYFKYIQFFRENWLLAQAKKTALTH